MMNDRIKQLRLELKLSQEAFCQRLGVTRGVITNIELHKVTPSEATIKSIVREFNANEKWIRTGEGEMFDRRDEELAGFFADALNDKPESFRKRFLRVLSRLDEDHWQMLEDMLDLLIDEEKTDS